MVGQGVRGVGDATWRQNLATRPKNPETLRFSLKPSRCGADGGAATVVRPQPIRSSGSEPSSGAGGSRSKRALAAALDWQHGSLCNKNCEGSATSDEDHPRCAPPLRPPAECHHPRQVEITCMVSSSCLLVANAMSQ